MHKKTSSLPYYTVGIMSYTSSTIPAPPKGKDAVIALASNRKKVDKVEEVLGQIEEIVYGGKRTGELFGGVVEEAEDYGKRLVGALRHIYDMMAKPGNTPYLTYNLVQNGVAIMGEFPEYECGVDKDKMKAQAGKIVENAREYKKNYTSKWTTKDGVKHSKRGTTTYQPGEYKIRLKGIDYSGYQQYPEDITLANLTNVTAGGPDFIGRIWEIKSAKILKAYRIN